MTSLTERPPTRGRAPDGTALTRAWIALLFVPVSFVAAFALAQVLYTATGHDPSAATPPHWAAAVALVPAGAVFVIPCVVALVYARRAVKGGHRGGYVPAVLAVAVAVGYGVLNVLERRRHFQRIADPGSCGKTTVVPHNPRPCPEMMLRPVPSSFPSASPRRPTRG